MKAPLIIKGKDNAKIQNACSKSTFEIAHNSGPFNLIPVLSAKRESNILKCLSNCYWNTNSTPKNTIKGQIKKWTCLRSSTQSVLYQCSPASKLKLISVMKFLFYFNSCFRW